MSKRHPVTAEWVRELLSYDPDTGVFRWRVCRRVKAGTIAGCPDRGGYIRINIQGIKHAAHRLAWLYVTGSWPVDMIDHRNRVKSDNRFENLREATKAQNLANSEARRGTKVGLKGVRAHGKIFQAQITFDGRTRFLGSFSNPEEAHAAYARAAMERFGEFHCAG